MSHNATPTEDLKLEDLIAKAKYKQHPYGKSWQPFDEATFKELVANVDRGGLEKEIVLYQDMVLDGWHRYLACLATKVEPKFAQVKGSDLDAAEAVHASGIRRHVSADQRYASFVMLCDACPAFKEKYEALKAKGEQQRRAGAPFGTGSQRVDVAKAMAEAAGVSKATAKKVERVKKAKPDAVAEIAAGPSRVSHPPQVLQVDQRDRSGATRYLVLAVPSQQAFCTPQSRASRRQSSRRQSSSS
jgi:hypothetical protein